MPKQNLSFHQFSLLFSGFSAVRTRYFFICDFNFLIKILSCHRNRITRARLSFITCINIEIKSTIVCLFFFLNWKKKIDFSSCFYKWTLMDDGLSSILRVVSFIRRRREGEPIKGFSLYQSNEAPAAARPLSD